jgi:hypothetical protein
VSLQRLAFTFKPKGVEIRTLYRTKSGSSPAMKARTREVAELTRTGLQEALTALERRVDVVGTSGFETRENIRNLQRKVPSG